MILYDQYFLLFQLAGLILLVAMIGAIVLTLRHRVGRQAAERAGADVPRSGQGDGTEGRETGAGAVSAAPFDGQRGRQENARNCRAVVVLIVVFGGRLDKLRPRRRTETGADPRDDMIGLEHYLTVAATLFVIGIFGLFLNRKNVIILLMSIELMLLAVNINFVAFSSFLGDLVGQVFTLFVLTVAAAEAAIGLAILVCFFRNRGTIAVEDVNVMKG